MPSSVSFPVMGRRRPIPPPSNLRAQTHQPRHSLTYAEQGQKSYRG